MKPPSRPLLALILATLSLPAAAQPLSCADHAIIMCIADVLGVPRSVADRLQIEESGDPTTGAWCDDVAKLSDEVSKAGYHSGGVYQLHLEPVHLAWLVKNFFPHDPRYFDWRDPIDNAVVALGYMHWLHDHLGTWERAACGFNAGRGTVLAGKVSAKTKAYARRIVEWPGTPEEPEPSFKEYPEAFRGAAAWEWRQQPGGPRR